VKNLKKVQIQKNKSRSFFSREAAVLFLNMFACHFAGEKVESSVFDFRFSGLGIFPKLVILINIFMSIPRGFWLK